MTKLAQTIKKISQLIPELKNREIAVAAIIFTFAYLLDLIISVIRHLPPSLKSIFIIWYALLSLQFPKLYIFTLVLGAVFFVLAMVMSFFDFLLVINNFFQVGFFLTAIAFIQILLLQWKQNINHD